MTAQSWRALGNTLHLDLPRLAAKVELLNPARGVHDLRVDANPLGDARLLGVALRRVEHDGVTSAVDYFLRGGDLAITYADRPEPSMRAQIYWRAASVALPGTIAAIELLVSVQTSLLDSCPKLSTRSELSVDRAFRLRDLASGTFEETTQIQNRAYDANAAARGVLLHVADSNVSYAEIVHPADATGAYYTARSHGASQQVEFGHELFAERLEKGVILRARVLGVLVDRANDQETAARQIAAFLREDLPLTT